MSSPTFSKLGPGTLKLGATASAQEFASACTKCEVKPEMKDEDATDLLSGEAFKPEGSVEGSLTGTFYQQYGSEGLVAWCWKHAGETLPFVFRPSKNEAMEIKGQCQVKPVPVGGDPKKNNTTDFDFPLVGGMPEMTFTATTTGS